MEEVFADPMPVAAAHPPSSHPSHSSKPQNFSSHPAATSAQRTAPAHLPHPSEAAHAPRRDPYAHVAPPAATSIPATTRATPSSRQEAPDQVSARSATDVRTASTHQAVAAALSSIYHPKRPAPLSHDRASPGVSARSDFATHQPSHQPMLPPRGSAAHGQRSGRNGDGGATGHAM